MSIMTDLAKFLEDLHKTPSQDIIQCTKTSTSKNITVADWNTIVTALAYAVADSDVLANIVASGTSTIVSVVEGATDALNSSASRLDAIVESVKTGALADDFLVKHFNGTEYILTSLNAKLALLENADTYNHNSVVNLDTRTIKLEGDVKYLLEWTRNHGILNDTYYDPDTQKLYLEFLGTVDNPTITVTIDLEELVNADELVAAIANLNVQNGGPECSIVQKSVLGAENTVNAQHGVAFGASNLVQGWAGFATGHGNQQNSDWGYVGGEYSWLGPNAYASIAFGESVSLDRPHGAAFGKFNDYNSEAVFAIGNGTSNTTRSNAFAVFEDGSIYLGGVTVTPEQLSGYRLVAKSGRFYVSEASFASNDFAYSGTYAGEPSASREGYVEFTSSDTSMWQFATRETTPTLSPGTYIVLSPRWVTRYFSGNIGLDAVMQGDIVFLTSETLGSGFAQIDGTMYYIEEA